ncbi:MAG: hypothetical protein HOP30_06020 [Cyclobacteriaceae bacterium]|nr:hypothetical protein [Cyclobacteriaceae bacterium]
MKQTSKLMMLSAIVLLAITSPLHAQMGFGKIEEIQQVKSRRLIVVIEEPSERMMKKLQKRPRKGDVEDYKADLATFNENLKAVVEKFWPYNKSGIQYKTLKEVEKLEKSNSKGYAVLTILSSKPSSMRAGFLYADGIYWVKDIKDDFEDRDDWMLSTMVINTIEDWGKKPVYYVPLFDVFPTKASMVYGIKSIDAYFSYRIAKKKSGVSVKEEAERKEEIMMKKFPLLANKTLLIRGEWLDEKLNEEEIKKIYPFKFQVCDREMMDKVVLEQDPNYAYGVVMPTIISTSNSNMVLYLHFILDAEDSQAMWFQKPKRGQMMVGSMFSGKAGHENFTAKILKAIGDDAQEKPEK